MKKDESVSDHLLEMELIAKELFDASNPLIDKIKVTTNLNSLPLYWDHIVISLTHNKKKIMMTSIRVILVLEEEMMKTWNKENGSFNLMMAQDIRSPHNKMKRKKFKKKK